ncbi:2-polyprenyl-6-methoxyphenol hydroxylase-like FAD-dependent oxidoreductase [Micromonospora sp. Llam0]|uniref:FAD-dependent monooxygenase n=1 Tax=Micromonospora sp. Llam0 TaxID=2485143 RepID=UPI000F4721E2|nr:FAD-dependent monooxygenase [Micromonospora sp. Llam0]ROO60645.1 2-polyprenyl-6-methoxyphenol hydroxylase-like FAD-dependent oxidoreductase [Micromonospora sp. Llam0]
MTTPKALIVGAGIGGLAAAATLRRVGIDVEIYEQGAEPRPAGSALSLTGNARVALRTLDLDLDVERRGRVYPALQLRTAAGRLIRTVPFAHLGDRVGAQSVAIHRAELHQALLAAAGDPPVRLDAAARRFQLAGDRVRVEFHDGRTAEGDLLIGADGFHSVVRRQIAGPEQPREPGYVCWLATVPMRHPKIRDGYAAHYWGRGQRFGLVQLGGDRVYWWATLNMAPAMARDWRGGKADIERTYTGWAEEVRAAIARTPESAIIAVPARDRPFLERWGHGPVTLLGDAAHPMLPSLGQGAAVAVEDAVVLAHCLRQAVDLPLALRRYEAARRERTRWMVHQAYALSRVEQLAHPLADLARRVYLRWLPGRLLDRRNEIALTFPGVRDETVAPG